MGLLDKNQDVIDFILTEEGKRLRSTGELRFAYYAFFDDEMDYNPVISNSGSLTAMQFTSSQIQQMEESIIKEAVSGYKDFNILGLDHTNVFRPLFTIPQGQNIVPKVVSVHKTGSIELKINQKAILDVFTKTDEFGNVLEQVGPVVRGYTRFNVEDFTFEYQYTPNSYPQEVALEGIRLQTFLSSSNGYIEVDPRHDLNDNVSFRNDLILNPVKNDVIKPKRKYKRGTKIFK